MVGVCSAAIYWGPSIMRRLSRDIAKFMDQKGYKSIDEMCGLALPYIHSLSHLPELKFRPMINQETCTLCRRCEETCPFGAIEMEPEPRIHLEKCDGCGICLAVCGSQGKGKPSIVIHTS